MAQGDKRHPVSCVFLQVDEKGKSSTMLVNAPVLRYADNERLARYSGGVTARGEDAIMTAEHADVFLSPAGKARTAGPSQLDHIVATTRVLVQQQERWAVSEKLVYTAVTGSFVMSGDSPELSDPVNGTVQGNSLTFYSHDDRVVVEGKGSSRAHNPHLRFPLMQTLSTEEIGKSYRFGRRVVNGVSLAVKPRRGCWAARPQRCGQNYYLLHHRGPDSARHRESDDWRR